MRDYQYYTDYAIELWEEGFNSKASKKRCLEKLSYAYEDLTKKINNIYRLVPREVRDDAWEELYWMIPHNLFQWKDKHSQAHVYYGIPVYVKEIDSLVELRIAVKETEIVPPVKSEEKIKKEKIEKTIEEIMERHRVKFLEAYSLTEELFPLLGLQVYVNSHWVTNQFGTTFVRNFFYLNDKLTALNTIMAVAGKHKRNHPELYKEDK